MRMAVRPSSSTSSAASTLVSDCRSRLEVASSSTSTRGWARKARAEGDQLALAGRERLAPLVHDGVEPVGQPVDELGEPDGVDRLVDLGVGRVGPGEGDVVADRAGEEERLLGHDAELAAQRVERHVADVVPVDRAPARRSGRRSG